MPTPPRGPAYRRIVERYDKEPLLSAVPSVSGVAAITFQVQALDATGAETFIGASSETVKVPALAAAGAETFTGTATITFAAPIIHSDPPLVLAIDEPHRYPYRHVQPPPPIPLRIPVQMAIEPTITPLPLPPAPAPAVAIDRRTLIMALFAAGMIDESEFTAMLLAA